MRLVRSFGLLSERTESYLPCSAIGQHAGTALQGPRNCAGSPFEHARLLQRLGQFTWSIIFARLDRSFVLFLSISPCFSFVPYLFSRLRQYATRPSKSLEGERSVSLGPLTLSIGRHSQRKVLYQSTCQPACLRVKQPSRLCRFISRLTTKART